MRQIASSEVSTRTEFRFELARPGSVPLARTFSSAGAFGADVTAAWSPRTVGTRPSGVDVVQAGASARPRVLVRRPITRQIT